MVDPELQAIAVKIDALNIWDRVSRFNWAVLPRGAEYPYVTCILTAGINPTLKARFLVFPGFMEFRNFAIARKINDYGVAATPVDFLHFEIVYAKSGMVNICFYRPGFVPVEPDAVQSAALLQVLRESYGLMMRIEEDAELPLKFVSRNALFARMQNGKNEWFDAPFIIPNDSNVLYEEKISLKKDDVGKAKLLPILPAEKWQLDFLLLPGWHTREAPFRLLYLLAAVDAATGERRMWVPLSVADGNDGLLHLWEGHAQRVLQAMNFLGKVPGEIHVRSGRVMRFLKPLAMQLPFKMVRHEKLETLDRVVHAELEKGLF